MKNHLHVARSKFLRTIFTVVSSPHTHNAKNTIQKMAKATSVLAKLLRAKRAVPISSNENEPLGIERPCGYHAIQFRNTDAYNLCDYLQNQVSSSTTKKWSEDDLFVWMQNAIFPCDQIRIF